MIEEPDVMYVIAFKFDKPAQEAIEQIQNRGYPTQYQHKGKPIKALGISVDCATKTIGGWEEVIL